MYSEIPTYHERLDALTEQLRTEGHLALVLVDASELAQVEHDYGSRAFEQVLSTVSGLVGELRGSEVRSGDTLALNERGGNAFLLFLLRGFFFRFDHGLHRQDPVRVVAHLGLLGGDPAIGQEKVTARVVRGIRHDHEMRQRARRQPLQGEPVIAGDVAIHHPEGPGAEQRQGVVNAAARLERLGTLFAER